MKWKRASIALLLSVLQSGLGQLYNRQVRKAFLCLVFLPALVLVAHILGLGRTFLGLASFAAVSIVFQLMVIVDAAQDGFRYNSESAPQKVSRSAVTAFIVLACVSIAAGLGGYAVRALGVKASVVRSDSMAPTLVNGDRVIADMTAYANALPRRGDVILFLVPGQNNVIYAKRVVGVEGDTLEGTDQGVKLNGQNLKEAYVLPENSASDDVDAFGPVTIPAGTLFVMGDNRANSFDSRNFGTVPVQSVRGKALFFYWSADHSRIGKHVK
jgi:signal peptidase I